MAAAALLNKDLRVCMLEKNEIPGRKLAATGGGRCNLTNAACSAKDATLDFFASIGIETYCDEEGRYYPYTNKAQDVINALLDAQGENVTVFCGVTADAIKKTDGGFVVTAGAQQFAAREVILAMGGKAAPQYGTTGDGYRLAKSLGHTVGRVYPILTPVECKGSENVDFAKLKGIRAKAVVTLLKDGAPLEDVPAEGGELQFTEDGLSGICIFNLTPHIKAEAGEAVADAMARYSICADLAPDFDAAQMQARESSRGILTGALAEAADREMIRSGCGCDMIKHWTFEVQGVIGWRHAQCTAGGVDMAELDLDTMASKLADGLYIIGELLDVQGPCGGFNLQNAWETAMKAARTISLKDRK